MITKAITRSITSAITSGESSSGGLEFISLEDIASPRLFGISTHVFNITAPAGTDGAVFTVLVQKKNQGINVTSIKVDGGVLVDAKDSIDSNPGGATNQLAAFEDKTFGPGAHTVEIKNADGIEGTTIIAVYYKNYTGLTGNFAKDNGTGAQAAQVILGDATWAVTPGNRGINICFAGGLTNLQTIVPDPAYDSGVAEYATTDVANNNFNGKLKTAVDLSFTGSTSNQQWTIDYDGAGVSAEIMVLAGEILNN